MISIYPLRDPQDESPAAICPKCGGEVWTGEPMFDWNEKGYICLDCFKSAVFALLDSEPRLAAAEMGVDYKEV